MRGGDAAFLSNYFDHLLSICSYFQFTKDFVNDCRDLQFAFFYDPFRSPRLVDRLEEDLIQHASVLSRCNSRNVAFKLDIPSTSELTPKYTLSNRITGTLKAFSFSFSHQILFVDVQLYPLKEQRHTCT